MEKTQKFTIINRIKLLRAITRRSLILLGYKKFTELTPESLIYDKRAFDETPIVILEIPDPASFKQEFAFLKHLKQNDKTKELNIIVTLAATTVAKNLLMSVVAFGVKDFILKTNDINALAKRLEITLAKEKQRKHKRTKFAEPLPVAIKGETTETGFMQDITIGGFLLFLERPLEKGAGYTFTVKLPTIINEQETFDVSATCRWVKGTEAQEEKTDSGNQTELPQNLKEADNSSDSRDNANQDDGEKPQLKAGFQIQNLTPEQKDVIQVLIREYCTVEV